MVKDLGSLNGTFVNGQPINEVELLPQDELVIAAVTLKAVSRNQRKRDQEERFERTA